MTTPIYKLVLASHDLAPELRVNDVPVLRLPGGRVETSFDVNPYVQTGTNTLTLHVRAAEGKGELGPLSACKVELVVQSPGDSGDGEGAPEPLASLVYERAATTGFEASPGVAGSPPVVRPTGLVATQAFELDTPFGPWSWTQAPPLSATEALRAEVLDIYRRMHGLLAARNVGALLQACDGQARDWQMAYGLPDLAAAQRQLGIASTLGDPDVLVEDFPSEVLTMELLGERRLVQLIDPEAQSPLRLRLRSSDEIVGTFNVVLCREAGSWMIAR